MNANGNGPLGGRPDINAPDARGTPASVGDWTERLGAVLADRLSLLGALERESADQEHAIRSADPSRLSELLAARQGLVDRFVAGQPELLALTQSMEERLEHVDRETSASLRRGVREIMEGLARITARDDAARTALREARDHARHELERIGTGSGARAAYRASSGGRRVGASLHAKNVYMDRRG